MESLGLPPIAVLSDPKLALFAVTIIDGCTWFQQYRFIKLPMIKNIFFVCLVIVVNGCLKGFNVSYILTNGGPGNSSELVANYLYKTAFSSVKFGYASSIAVFLLIESLTYCLLYNHCISPDNPALSSFMDFHVQF